jgi:ketosteroid isomerase-like protein
MHTFKKYFFSIIIITGAGCIYHHTAAEIKSAMKQYDRLIMKTDADSIALMYTVDGELGEIAKGRDSIKNFLQRFKNIRVLSQNSITDTITIVKDSCVQKGSYNQISILNEKDTMKVRGRFNANWIWTKKDGWKIKKMKTSPWN